MAIYDYRLLFFAHSQVALGLRPDRHVGRSIAVQSRLGNPVCFYTGLRTNDQNPTYQLCVAKCALLAVTRDFVRAVKKSAQPY